MQNHEKHIYIITRDADNRILNYRVSDSATPFSQSDIPAGYSAFYEDPATVASKTDFAEKNAYIATHRRAFVLSEIDVSNATEATPSQATYTPQQGVKV